MEIDRPVTRGGIGLRLHVRIRSMTRWIAHRSGRRGAVLAVLAMVDTVYGLAIIRAGFAPRASIGWWPASAATVLFLPTIIWGWVSTINGLFLTCGVFTRHDAVFYGTGVALEFLWGLASLDYFLLRGGRELWGVSAVHLGLAALVLINAGWGEPGETHRA